jgi:phosphoribosyl-ATP pyrophosphohydrolase
MKMFKQLFEIIEDRRDHPREGSYTNQLLQQGNERVAQKVGEEAVEVVIASLSQSRERTIEESADLIYHLFVLLVQKGIRLEEIEKELEQRHIQINRQ